MTARSTLLLAPAWLLLSCHGKQLTGPACSQDSDCVKNLPGSAAADWRCETTTGVCYCRTDQACPPAQFCNAAGFCQDRAGCQTNADCGDPSLFCDTTTGSCLSVGRCSIDLHCPLGQVCDTNSATCVPGCRSNGDCNGVSCLCGDGGCNCTADDQATRESCPIGTCDPYFCADKTFCKFGQQCGVIPDSGIPYNQCYSDKDPNYRPYCDNCTFGGGLNTCGYGPNYCLVDTAHPGAFFCGSDCSEGQSCPNGYSCQDVIVVFTEWVCYPNNPACHAETSLPCGADKDCPRGGHCAISTGQDAGYCTGRCSIPEGNPEGFCTCLVDSDCAQQTCGTGGQCSIDQKPCVTDQDCNRIHCVDFNGAGGCLIGQNCAPTGGLTCQEVQ